MISLDTETTGLDIYKGAKPFFVTICNLDGETTCWEWDVDPYTRQPEIPEEDIEQIKEVINTADRLVLQNGKFDVSALNAIDEWFGKNWPWHKVEDTLISGHILGSNQPKDLTTLSLKYLRINIQPLEDKLQEICKIARRICRTKDFIRQYGEWAIADEGREDMPSAKSSNKDKDKKTWKYDTWLPRMMYKLIGEKDLRIDDSWESALRDYGNADSFTTVNIFPLMESEMVIKDLWSMYRFKMKNASIVQNMEYRGVTLNKEHVDEKMEEFTEQSETHEKVLTNISYDMGHVLELAKGAAVNGNMRTFMFDVLKLPGTRGKKAKTDAPSLDKEVMSNYLITLPERSKERLVVKSLLDKRDADKALSDMRSYQRFWVDVNEGKPDSVGGSKWRKLHPFLNPTGTATTRMSCSNPNEQNISKKEGYNIRYCFGPAEGREWWSLDAKNIELRIPFYESGEEEMIDLFEKEKEPPYYGSNHILIFSVIWPELWEAAIKEVGLEKAGPYCKKKYASTNYQWTKNGNFAVQYSAVNKSDGTGTADRAYHQPGAQAKIMSRFARLTALNEKWVRYANKHGYVETMPFKSINPRRGYPLLCSRTEYGGILPTVPLNYHVQGTAGLWKLRAMNVAHDKLQEWYRETGFDGYITMEIHDEIVFDFPKSKVHPKEVVNESNMFKRLRSNLWRIQVIQKLMEKGGEDINVPTPVGIEYNEDNWSEGITF